MDSTINNNNNTSNNDEFLQISEIPLVSPLQLLYSFVQQQQAAMIPCSSTASTTSGVAVDRDAAALKKLALDDILRVADFLFPRSLLDAALAVLEQHPSSSSWNKQPTLVVAHAITQISCPRRSSVFLVKPQKAKKHPHHHHYFYQQQQQQQYDPRKSNDTIAPPPENAYLCLIDPVSWSKPKTEESSSTLFSSSTSIQYCSCRSFLEKSIRSRRGKGGSSTMTLCKHLLAIALLEPLGMTCQKIHVSSEEEWSQIVLHRILPGRK
jgi:hypothetical protein